MIKVNTKVNSTRAIEKIKAIRLKNNANILAMIAVPKIAIVTPAMISMIMVIIFLPRK
jgi:hypothetical protein